MEKKENSNPAITLVRACKEYDPTPMMRPYEYANGKQELYLEVKYRVDWFLHYCQEKGILGTLKESITQLDVEHNLVMGACTVYMDGQEVAYAEAARSLTVDKFGNTAADLINTSAQTCCTIAKGRALANLGFGTVNGNQSEDGEELPPESGVPLQGGTVPPLQQPLTGASTLLGLTGAAERTSAEEKKPAASNAGNSAPSNRKSVPSSVPLPKTLAEAMAVKVPVGLYKGKTLGEAYALDQTFVERITSDRFAGRDRHPALVAGAKIILAAKLRGEA